MGKKTSFLFAVVLMSVFLVGCGAEESKNMDKTMSDVVGESQEKESMMEHQMMEESGLQALLKKNAKVKCEYTMEAEDGEGEAGDILLYMDGDKFKTVSKMGEMEATTVFDGDTYYTWVDGETKQASKISVSCMEKINNEMGEEDDEIDDSEGMEFNSVDDIVAQEKNMKMNCSEVSSVDLSIPSDIEFIDTCEMMEGVQNMTDNMDLDNMQEQMEKMEQMQKDMGM